MPHSCRAGLVTWGIHLPWTTTQLSFSEWLLAVNEDVQQPFYLLHIITLLLQQCHELVLCS